MLFWLVVLGGKFSFAYFLQVNNTCFRLDGYYDICFLECKGKIVIYSHSNGFFQSRKTEKEIDNSFYST